MYFSQNVKNIKIFIDKSALYDIIYKKVYLLKV